MLRILMAQGSKFIKAVNFVGATGSNYGVWSFLQPRCLPFAGGLPAIFFHCYQDAHTTIAFLLWNNVERNRRGPKSNDFDGVKIHCPKRKERRESLESITENPGFDIFPLLPGFYKPNIRVDTQMDFRVLGRLGALARGENKWNCSNARVSHSDRTKDKISCEIEGLSSYSGV